MRPLRPFLLALFLLAVAGALGAALQACGRSEGVAAGGNVVFYGAGR